MVAVIKTGHSILRLLNYNENKVKEGVARLIGAENYPMEAAQLSFSEKANRLLRQAALNENVSRNSVHISLNFDPSESFSDERLQEIAAVYMQKIGMDDLPYLVYQHFDAGHPHIHIVSVKVRANGKRVDTQNIGLNQSSVARKEIEIAYGLIKAKDSEKREAYRVKPVNVPKVLYGKAETKRAIGIVLNSVLFKYKYASLPELNAVLRQYNVVADRGGEDSRIFRNRGLVYRVLDGQGNKVGVPIKASDFYNKLTLPFLEEKFGRNEKLKDPKDRLKIKNAIDLFFLHPPVGLNDLVQALKKEGVDTVIRQNDEGVVYGITYVDHESKCVFNGSALGKAYSAKAILERCAGQPGYEEKNKKVIGEKISAGTASRKMALSDLKDLTDALLGTDEPVGQMDWELKRKRKKKKRRIVPD